ncbi:MAG: glycine/sarcosine/betaine reductase selenoprotein B family protein [Desulfobacteraceae bacterium]
MSFSRLKNKNLAKLTTRFPLFAKKFTESFASLETEGVPWASLIKPLAECKVAIVTTAGVHHRNEPCFDMNDPDGDPTFRVIDVSRATSDLIITHDYYDHSDADKDINVVFPIQRLWELRSERFIGDVARTHYGFMGHITGGHIQTLLSRSAPEVARMLKMDAVDVVLLTPG